MSTLRMDSASCTVTIEVDVEPPGIDTEDVELIDKVLTQLRPYSGALGASADGLSISTTLTIYRLPQHAGAHGAQVLTTIGARCRLPRFTIREIVVTLNC